MAPHPEVATRHASAASFSRSRFTAVNTTSVLARLVLYNNHPTPPYQGGEPVRQFPSSLRRGTGGGERLWLVNC